MPNTRQAFSILLSRVSLLVFLQFPFCNTAMGAYINGFYVFAPVTATDHAGLLYVAVILSLAFSVLTLATRVHIKRRIFGSDDWLVAGATVSRLPAVVKFR